MQVLRLCAGFYLFVDFKWRDTKVSSHFRAIRPRKKRKSKWKKWITTLCFLNACLSVPTSHAFHPLPSFPTWLRQRGVSIGYPFSPRLLSHPLFLSHVSLSFHPSFLCSLSSLPTFLSPFPSIYLAFFPPLSIRTHLSGLLCWVQLNTAAAGPSLARRKLTSSCVWVIIEDSCEKTQCRVWQDEKAISQLLKPISFPPVEFVTSETSF